MDTTHEYNMRSIYCNYFKMSVIYEFVRVCVRARARARVCVCVCVELFLAHNCFQFNRKGYLGIYVQIARIY
jgi:hypothetical protein